MFGSSKFKKVKQNTLKNNKERKKYFAIKNFHNKNQNEKIFIIAKDKNNKH